MNESIAEANLTVITITLIGVAFLGVTVVIPRLLSSLQDSTCCLSNNGRIENQKSGMQCVIPIRYDNETDKTTYSYENLPYFNNEYCK